MNTRNHLAGQTKRFYLLLIFCLFGAPSFAQGLKVAVAANLQSVITVLQKDFKQKTNIDIDPIVGSSGKLVAQIRNGAPFDVFLSADMSFAQSLLQDGFSAAEPVVYAYGNLIICSTRNIGFENWERTMLTPRIKKIAIANPSVAPYGLAAEELLKKKGILDNVKSKMVYGESIAQVNTYITTGVVSVGFTTQALVKDRANKTTLYWKLINPAEYAPIKQGMVVLKHGETNPDAAKFYRYILSAGAKRIFEKYGYRVK
ncbi:molybdate ABC transporter substrate-binding protein [Mucilaginibacter sp. UR6-11]|uniref:molybdate ABC transporter substrate-binding protein n=1 Tax=Mucilaginibacter sp. UR6-11 TaxID=1435644 RepID=UPI001E497B86|nr:molybdate ABC transporter substrate-binding protein [Mucilaginibacter sp. UR6-11]MCC8424449.1 molybdate ABC transporter substrate-binding protein [Mucilaginibacter sp. UR6-11]